MTRLGWRSLRVRLPLIISAVIVLVLAAFLWTINRALEQTLLGAGGVRAQAAADQVAALMATAAARGVGEVRRLAGTDEVRRYLSAPSNGDAEAVRKLLAPLSTAGQPPAELRDRSDATVLVIPPPPLARETRRGALARAFWHRALTADQISPDKRRSRLADTHPQTP